MYKEAESSWRATCEDFKQTKKDYIQQILRKDNYELRRNFINQTTFLIFASSFLINRRLRFSMRNAGAYFLLSSAVVCPERLNPFGR